MGRCQLLTAYASRNFFIRFLPTQVRNIFEKLKAILQEAGSSFDKVVKVNIYLSDLSYREQFLNPIWNEYFGNQESPPSRTTVEAGLGPEVYVDEMIAST
jgi:2-iminobutanoate/2-iminopropanoate deaminase